MPQVAKFAAVDAMPVRARAGSYFVPGRAEVGTQTDLPQGFDLQKTAVNDPKPTLRILGIRGIPAAHGGFETFAEHLALYLVAKGWRVVVYCQESTGDSVTYDEWQGVERVHVPIAMSGAKGTMLFDWRCILDAAKQGDLCLTLGYNTALFCAVLRAKGIPNIINMDGIEWSRAKWGPFAKAWFWLNDIAGCWLGNHLIADHPEIAKLLSGRVLRNKITTIGYGAPAVKDLSEATLDAYGLRAGQYMTVIARPEPENSVDMIVEGFSKKRRGMKLVVLGDYDDQNPFHAKVKRLASDEVVFLGAIYDAKIVQSLRLHSWAYVHGHQVGGTNPSLVEALGAGNAVIAHDNRFNRGVVGGGAVYFSSPESFDSALSYLQNNPAILNRMAVSNVERHQREYTWDHILGRYQTLLLRHLPVKKSSHVPVGAARRAAF